MKIPWNLLRFIPMAQRVITAGRLPALLFAVARKGAAEGNRLGKLKDDLRLLQALCLAYWRGEYRAISPKAMVSVVAGLMYFLSPIDLIPDWIPVIGMLDDIVVLGWVMKTLEAELDAFRAWRAMQSVEKLAVVERLPATPALLELEHRKD
ncbi:MULTISPECIES: YkvA family protein [unclassified Pseudomonas]|uniref:YkvA family protein n=1 Tax=unclassified Pseudomonas TaxID=196821 RepID=UPI002AC967EB|nr:MULTISPECIES: YkvA family protein [unclassified Pseudomonas]MEB0042026.1 YkvA family protein [Pseudomonas sp. MH10]MEB0078147.1 YkvA family protein [Pseudomonas sp. MH10out]MEB0093425.1 YkvA family protein [Pseudomonas sp. CCI4.2]MEB0102201.1 YkvA family protein [Pseudomonas sp. CCI3.2]MEB0121409.1 YkvA family protein [Pseudomonas sp. CCI1.2]